MLDAGPGEILDPGVQVGEPGALGPRGEAGVFLAPHHVVELIGVTPKRVPNARPREPSSSRQFGSGHAGPQPAMVGPTCIGLFVVLLR